MGLFNEPISTDKRLFLTSDTQSRVTVSGTGGVTEPAPDTALNIQLKGFETFDRTAEDAMYTDPNTGLLRLPDLNAVRFEVNGLILEPDPLLQYIRDTGLVEVIPDSPVTWDRSAGMVVSVPTETAPDGVGVSARVLTKSGGGDEYINQILAGLDPITTDYRFSVFLKPLPPASIPDIEMFINFTGGAPDPAVVVPFTIDPTSGWLRYDINGFNANVAHTAVEIRIILKTDGDIAVWGANFTESTYLASYRPRLATDPLVTTGEEHLIYELSSMGIEPELNQAFTVLWEFIPVGEQGRHAPQIAFAGGDSNGGPLPAAPALYDKALAFGAHPSVATDFRLAITDSTSGAPVVYTHAGTHNWSRYSHQKWAFVIFNDGSQKCRFFANGTFLGETVISPALTEDNYTKFVLPQAALHRRIETLAEALTDDAAISATTIT